MPIATYKIIGYVDDNPKSSTMLKNIHVRCFSDVEHVIKDTGVQTVLICAPGLEPKKVSIFDQSIAIIGKTSSLCA